MSAAPIKVGNVNKGIGATVTDHMEIGVNQLIQPFTLTQL